MSGPGHYGRAEEILAGVRDAMKQIEGMSPETTKLETVSVMLASVNAFLAEAQVHATLALAAATACPTVRDRKWAQVIA